MYIDEYIKKVLSYSPCICMSWGIESWSPIMECEEGEGGLALRVNGYKHQGEVRIILNWMDLFDVTLYNNDGSIKETCKNIYVDSLVNTIDWLVERVENYEEKVKQTYGFN